jgi:beta-galactosidase GanA
MYIYAFLVRMSDTSTVVSQNIDISSWDILYMFKYYIDGCYAIEICQNEVKFIFLLFTLCREVL